MPGRPLLHVEPDHETGDYGMRRLLISGSKPNTRPPAEHVVGIGGWAFKEFEANI